MKKLLFLLCVLLPISGCVIIEEDFPTLQKTDIPMYEEWTEITFKTLTGKEDLTISRNLQDRNSFTILTPGYNQNFLAVALLQTDCEKSKLMAPYLNELATRIIPNMHDMNYVPVFLDAYEDSTNNDISWISQLSNIDFFMNAMTVCSDNACQDVFLPLLPESSAASIYLIDTHDITKTEKIYSWNLTEDPQLQAEKMENALAVALGLKEIYVDPSTDGWNDTNINNSY